MPRWRCSLVLGDGSVEPSPQPARFPTPHSLELGMPRRRFPHSRSVVVVVLLLAASGCTGWHADPGVSPTAVIAEHPSRVRLELSSGRQVELRDPAVRGDTVVGWAGHDTVEVAAADIMTVSRRRFSFGRTVARVGIGVGALYGLAALVCAMDPCY